MFICILEDIADICNAGLDRELLNIEAIAKIRPEKAFLMQKAKEALLTNGIEYKPVKGDKFFVKAEGIPRLLKKDPTLKPLLTFK